jgi:hypothetical protein
MENVETKIFDGWVAYGWGQLGEAQCGTEHAELAEECCESQTGEKKDKKLEWRMRKKGEGEMGERQRGCEERKKGRSVRCRC